jgi:hypothetical protein
MKLFFAANIQKNIDKAKNKNYFLLKSAFIASLSLNV